MRSAARTYLYGGRGPRRPVHLLDEFKAAFARIRRNPSSATGILVSLMLGIAVSVSMFSVLNSVIGSLPYPNGERIAFIQADNPQRGIPRAPLTRAEAIEGLADVQGFDYTAYYAPEGDVFTGTDGTAPPELLSGVRVSEQYFSVYGTSALLGRTLIPSDFLEQRPVAVLTHSAWMELLGGDPEAIGKTLHLQDGRTFELVGVMPRSFELGASGPLLISPWNGYLSNAPYDTGRYVTAIGLLEKEAFEEGGTVPREALQAAADAVHEAYGTTDDGWSLSYLPLLELYVGPEAPTVLSTLFGVALLVLLIACSTAAILMALRMRQRTMELALRTALGAGRLRLGTAVLAELSLLVAAATVSGVLLAFIIVRIVQPLAIGYIPRAEHLGIDTTTLLFAILAAVASLSLSAIAPLLHTLRLNSRGLRLGGGSNREIRGTRRIILFPAAGIALSAIALVTALALLTSLVKLNAVDLGFRTSGIAALELTLPATDSQADVPQFLDRVFEEFRSQPGVIEAGAMAYTNLFVPGELISVLAAGSGDDEALDAYMRRGSPGFHALLDIPIVRGRDIAESDVNGSRPVAVINRALARLAFGSEDPIGKTLSVTSAFDRASRSLEVVGVTADYRNSGVRARPIPAIVASIGQFPVNSVTLLVRMETIPPNVLESLKEAVWRVSPDQTVRNAFMLDDRLAAQTGRWRFFATATGWFAVIAVVLGAVGVNAVLSSLQRRRVQEMGLRLALGATSRHIIWSMARTMAAMLLIGLLVGGVMAVPIFRWLLGQSLVFETTRLELWILFVSVGLVLLATASAAAVRPIWRASRVTPMEALRHE